ncbi:MAG: sigma-70 family RNA polymerase sigma factor [bacterium]|nr:sigma-70 family RNA polymerase sigma factor [bacterium]
MYDDLKPLVIQAQTGDRRAFSSLIDRCKHAVYGVCLSLMGEFDLAEDMAQEAFIQAYLRLGTLKDPDRFAGWLRTIAMNRCRTHLRHKKPALVSMETLGELAVTEEVSGDRADMTETALLALAQLSEANRQALTLFYLGDRSVREIGAFLGVSEGAVKVRLYRARRELREETLKMVADTVNGNAPGPEFEARVNTMIDAIEAGDRVQVERLLQDDPDLVEARRKDGQTVLLWAAHAAHHGSVNPDVSASLLQATGQPDLFTAANFGLQDRVRKLIEDRPECVAERDGWTRTALHWAAHGGQAEVASLMGWTDRVAALLEADPERARARMAGGESPLLLASFRDEPELVQLLLDRGADVNQTGPNGATALKRAIGCGCDRVVALLQKNKGKG